MSHNDLTSFETDRFIFSDNLTNLFVQNNRLQHFSAKLFKNVTLVKLIDLQNNSIESLELDLLNNLKTGLELFISGKNENFWNC